VQDLHDIPKDLKRRITFIPVDHMDDVLEAALDRDAAPAGPRSRSRREPGVTPVRDLGDLPRA
jgi:predicted ATP-dependent protease